MTSLIVLLIPGIVIVLVAIGGLAGINYYTRRNEHTLNERDLVRLEKWTDKCIGVFLSGIVVCVVGIVIWIRCG